MSAVILPFPRDPANYTAGLLAVRARAQASHATTRQLGHALAIFTAEFHAGRSTAAAVALANASMRPVRTHAEVPPCA